ncbi:MAG: DivIVA domain-containing protein [Oscillospiraceae bacterium]|nr:DivIVA domain-containing protein [Oscillospiraceae bacterium]
MLTPQDLQEVSFEKAKIGGYVMKSVDEFLEPLMDDYVTLYKENAVLKSKMRLLVERLEAYRANEAHLKAAAEKTREECDAMLAEAQRKGDELVAKARQEAQTASRDADATVVAENDRLRQAKEATAEFISAVEAQIAQQQQTLEALKKLDLPQEKAKPVRKAYDYESEKDLPRPQPELSRPHTELPQTEKPEDIAASIEQSVASITGETPRPKAEPKPDPKAATRVMPALDERTTAKFANLKFGKNYQP